MTLLSEMLIKRQNEEEIMGDIVYGKTRSEIVSEFTASEQWASNCAYYGVNV